MRERLELGREHIALLIRQRELPDPFGDRQPVEASQRAERASRIVWYRQRLADAVDEPVPAAPGDLVALLDRPRPALGADVPADATSASPETSTRSPARVISDHVWGWCQWTQAPPYSIADPFHGAVHVRPPSRSRASSSRTERPRRDGLPRGGDAGEAAANDDHVVHEATAAGAATGTRRRATASTATAPSAPTNTGFSSIRSSDSSTRTSPTRSASRAAAATSDRRRAPRRPSTAASLATSGSRRSTPPRWPGAARSRRR